MVFPSVEIAISDTLLCVFSMTSEVFKLELHSFDEYQTVHWACERYSELHTLRFLSNDIPYTYTVFGGAQTEISNQGHTLYNLLHMRMDLTCATNVMSKQVHTIHSLLRIHTEISHKSSRGPQMPTFTVNFHRMHKMPIFTGIPVPTGNI